MKKFHFSLEHVLGYKRQVLDGLQNEHAILQQRVTRQERHLEDIRSCYQTLNREFRQAKEEGVTVAELRRYESGLRYWQQEQEKGLEVLRQYRQEAEDKREEMVAARQGTASLEKLREKKREAYRREEEKNQEAFVEELVAARRSVS